MKSRALIAGATGLIGSNLAEHLVSRGWEVYGIGRKAQGGVPGVRPVEADLLEPETLRSSLAGIDPSHVFFTTWVWRANEEENIAANGALVRNLLAALDRSNNLRHVALVTGLKHYLGPFEDYAKPADELGLRDHERPGLLGRAWRGRGRRRDPHRRPYSPRASALGSALAVGMFLTTLRFLVTTPGVWEPSAGGFPALSGKPGQFLIKDLPLLGISLWTLGEAWKASEQKGPVR
jgi:hypothetical protein